MATRFLSRSLLSSTKQNLNSLFTRSFTSVTVSKPAQSLSTPALSLLRLRPLVFVAANLRNISSPPVGSLRGFSTRQANSSLNDPNPNWSNRPPKETILLDGCDFEHWLVVVEKPDESWTRDQIIDSYIKTLAQVVGSEEEARMKIYSVSTKHYFAFGALVSEELSYKLKELPGVRWVLPDSYLDVRNKDYGGEPFINGEAVPYDPKYHAEWVRNNSRANERNRRNDRPRNHDRSRNFDRNRPRNQDSTFQSGPQNMGPNNPGYPPPNNMAPNQAPNPQYPNAQIPGGAPYPSQTGPTDAGYTPNVAGGNTFQNNMSGTPNNSPNVAGGYPPSSGEPYQPGRGPNQPSYAPNMPGGNPYQNRNVSGMPNNAANPQYGNPYQNSNAPTGAWGNPYQNQTIPGRDETNN